MNRILCCGFSHAGSARNSLTNFCRRQLGSHELEFLATAGPKNRGWSANGGKYQIEGTLVERRGGQISFRRDLSDYSLILFIGQWTNPTVLFQTGFDWTQPLSSSLLAAMMRGLIENPVIPTDGPEPIRFANDPLCLFPGIAPCQTVLVPDPAPCHEAYIAAPLTIKRAYYRALEGFCAEKGIYLSSQPDHTLTKNLSTKPKFLRRPGDYLHMSNHFWDIQIEEATGPLIQEILGAAGRPVVQHRHGM